MIKIANQAGLFNKGGSMPNYNTGYNPAFVPGGSTYGYGNVPQGMPSPGGTYTPNVWG